MQDFYSDENGYEYSVARLVADTAHLEPFDMPVAGLDVGSRVWEHKRTLQDLAWHFKRVQDADLSKPIILDWRGHVADGRHRIIKALMEGRETIKAVRMDWRMHPCRQPNTDQ